jgi:DNA-binding response OmpR family regulator
MEATQLTNAMPHVLIVEDESKLAKSLQRELRTEGYETTVAATGEQCLELALRQSFQAIILDLLLPGCGGMEALRELRARSCRTPVLVLTARDTVNDRVEGLNAGADDYLVKPFALAELVARLRALLRRNETLRDVLLRAGDLEMDRLSRRVARAGVEIDLSTREYALLEFLLLHANTIVTRSMIAREVWNEPDALLTNVIDVYIGTLRRKIGRANHPPLIHTVRGMGYELRATLR